MSNVFGILTAIVLGLSVFIALKNNKAHKEAQDASVQAGEALTKREGELKAAQEKLEAVPLEIKAAEEMMVNTKQQEEQQTKRNDELKAQIESSNAKIEENKAKLEEVREKTAQVGDIKELADRLGALNSELEELDQLVPAAEAKLANLTAQSNAAQTTAETRKNELERITQGESVSSLRTRIASVYPNWGFVTLASGNNAGVVMGSTLDVIRNDEVVAKLLVTAVENTTASASIVPDTVKDGNAPVAGDRVVPGAKVEQN